MTMEELLWWGTGTLAREHVPDPELDARYLLLEAFDISLSSYLAVKHRELSRDGGDRQMRETFEALIEKRSRRIPLQHLTGVQEFMGFEFMVNEHVLIPRQDTETLVELVLAERKDKAARVLDMCAGSGCIAISLALMGGYKEVDAADISKEALKVAEENAKRLLKDYKGRFRLIESDMFEGIEKGRLYDMIVSNPPYIRRNDIEGLEPEVKLHEPRLALDGDADGLAFYRILADKCREYLRPGGYVYTEIGYDQATEVERLFAGHGYESIVTVRDLAGNNRVTRALWPG